jgi:Kef-type K+ transport system membrane component KefB
VDPLAHLAIIWAAVFTFDKGNYATLSILLTALVVGLLAHVFGFQTAVGAYMAGLMITAFFLNIPVPITITWWRPHYLTATASS